MYGTCPKMESKPPPFMAGVKKTSYTAGTIQGSDRLPALPEKDAKAIDYMRLLGYQ
jgi:hypothetical protein